MKRFIRFYTISFLKLIRIAKNHRISEPYRDFAVSMGVLVRTYPPRCQVWETDEDLATRRSLGQGVADVG